MQAFQCKLISGIVLFSISSAAIYSQSISDQHRAACTNSNCRAVRAFIKMHYCGESPFGNGPADGCKILPPKKPALGTSVIADFNCNGSNAVGKPLCSQTGSVSADIRAESLKEMHQNGLPQRADQEVFFSVLNSTSTGWLLLEAYYEYVNGDNLTLCQILAVVDPEKQLHVLRKVPYQKTDVDGKTITTWSTVDIVDVHGQQEFILEGDAYEDHWFEAIEMHNGKPVTVYSGLGYYL